MTKLIGTTFGGVWAIGATRAVVAVGDNGILATLGALLVPVIGIVWFLASIKIKQARNHAEIMTAMTILQHDYKALPCKRTAQASNGRSGESNECETVEIIGPDDGSKP